MPVKQHLPPSFFLNTRNCPEFVNADLLAQGLSPFYPDKAAIQAGRLMLKQINRFAKGRADFGFETTLSGRTFVGLITRLKKEGYIVRIYFLWLPSAELAAYRVADRVKKGGTQYSRGHSKASISCQHQKLHLRLFISRRRMDSV